MLRILFISSVALTVILFTLKAAGVPNMLAWSWIACFAPLAVILATAVVYAMVATAIEMKTERRRSQWRSQWRR